MAQTKWIVLAALFSFIVTALFYGPSLASSTQADAEIERIGPEEAMEKA